MYATSLRCTARNPGGNGAKCGPPRTCRRFLSAHVANAGRPLRPTPPPHHNLRPPAPTTTPALLPSSSSPSSSPSSPSSPSSSPLRPAIPPRSRSQQRRHYAVGNKQHPPQTIAVLGGGLTGLTTAWYLTRLLPEAKITIYEANKRLGGWIETEKAEVKTPDGKVGTVHFERAARMIKPQSAPGRVPKWDDLVFYDLVTKLNLTDQLVHAKQDEEAVSGFIYYPDHLVPLPKVTIRLSDPLGALRQLANLAALLFEPLFRGLIPAVLNIFRTRKDPFRKDLFRGRRDMSVGEYYAYRLGSPALVDKLMSAMVHGITGGDVWKLSMGSGFLADQLVPTDDEPITNVPVRSVDYEMMLQLARDKAVFDLASQHLDTSALWFRDGFSTLTNALADALEKNPNVTFVTGKFVTRVEYIEKVDKVGVHISKSLEEAPAVYDKVVSTIFAKKLYKITDKLLPSLLPTTAVSIMLVNIWYPVPRINFPYNGFGYLVPQALPFEQNPECVLGVIFDSDREFPLPTPSDPDPAPRGADTVQGTKLTVMMGGHYYTDWPLHVTAQTFRAKKAALAAVERHLRLPPELTEQAHASAKLCRDCIPQHLVGHARRMRAAHSELEWAFKGRLAVVGQSYQNPGVLNMLRAARDVAVQIAGREEGAAAEWSVGDTGLERFTRQPKYLSLQRHMLPLRYGSRAFVDESGQVRLREGALETGG
ncbi:uncharacterized protein P884DRAFT_267091 [Thermothelomyces heterothallicus CBS 202.75]|uniref:uncharacterized protein n=1 Tax=Thermothelomyces heterothallicus CBS 202.75 TaxID=1149848 RepID=UPI003741FD25